MDKPEANRPLTGGDELFCTFCGDPCDCGWLDAEQVRLTTTQPEPERDDDLKLLIAHTIIEDLRVQHPGIEQIDNERGDVWLPGGSTPQSSGCIIDVHSIAQSVEQQVRATLTPGHTDLMISPEAIDAFLDANPAPEPERDGAVERVRKWVEWPYTTDDQIAVKSELSTFTAGDLRHILTLLEKARAEAVRSEAHRNDLADKITSQSIEIGALKSRAETAERQRDEAVRALRECRDRLTAFVGAVAEVTDCSADVEAIKRADAVISKSGDA